MTGRPATEPAARRPSPRRFDRHRRWLLPLIALVAAAAAVGVLELAYRGQWLDFHRAELIAANPAEALDPDDSRPTVLVLGDSFTAGLDNWPTPLRLHLGPGVRVVNSALGGSTIRQANAILDGRLRRFRPRRLVYQIYAGNDLLDLRHPIRGPGVGPARRCYWRLVDRGWLVPWFVNTRLRIVLDRLRRSDRPGSPDSLRLIEEMEARPFAVADYSPRSRMLLAASPTVVTDQLALSGDMRAAWTIYAAELDRFAERCRGAGAGLTLVVVPHCVQVHPDYARRFAALGARFPDPALLGADPTPFVAELRRAAARSPGVEVVDPLARFRAIEAAGRRLYFNNDPHLDPRGRLELARIVAGALEPR